MRRWRWMHLTLSAWLFVRRPKGSGSRFRPMASREWCCATGSFTGREPISTTMATSPARRGDGCSRLSGAAVVALEHGDGVYNIADDDPAAARDWIPAFCRDVGAPAPIRVPGWLVALLAGRLAEATLQLGRGASNAKAKRELGWAPRHPTWRGGFTTG